MILVINTESESSSFYLLRELLSMLMIMMAAAAAAELGFGQKLADASRTGHYRVCFAHNSFSR